ncbi:ATP-binding protein [Neolewinella persica]|uniref:ATP-binding protein n=1 Tax=Neolewinella persica TaxID=70998 RepID=UPI00039B1650|nr:tetratricopeptide repeat-containing sensor histidine kinase [Neolewinella persica]
MHRLLLICISIAGLSTVLYGQPRLVDSITTLLETEHRPLERMDLLVGLCRAVALVEGLANSEPYAQAALAYARKTGNIAGESHALLYLYQSEIDKEKDGLLRALPALRLAEESNNPSLEILAIYHIIEYYILDNTDLPNTRKWIAEGRSRLVPSVSPKQRGNFYKDLGEYFKIAGQLDSSYYWLEAALREFERVGDYRDPALGRSPATHWDGGDMNTAHAETYLGRLDLRRGDYALAEKRFNRALALGQKWNSVLHTGWSLMELGDLYAALGDIPTAIEYNSTALQLFEAKDLKVEIFVCAEQIGYLFMDLQDPLIAEQYFNKAYDVALENHDTIDLINIGVAKSFAARSQADFQAAWRHARDVMELGELTRDSIGIGMALLEFGHIATTEGNPEFGLSNYDQASRVLGRLATERETLHNFLGRARAYLALGQIESAQRYVQLANTVAGQTSELTNQLSILRLQTDIAAAGQDYLAAYRYQQQYQEATDSLRDQVAIHSLKQEQVRQNVVDFQQQKESAEREADLLGQRNRLYLALGTALLALLLVGVFLFLRLRSARQQLADRNENLHQLNATKDRFFGIIAHDLRNPVVALNMAGEQLRFSLGQGAQDTALRQANNINKTVNRLSGLLDNLLQWALLQTGSTPYRPENLPLAALTEEAVDLYEQAAELKQVRLNVDVPHSLIVRADPRALLSVIRNLVNNAIKFTSAGGEIAITARLRGQEVIIDVADNGIGMSRNKQKELFGLSTASLPGTAGERGSGLGLLLCQQLVRQNGGSIHLVSEEGKGSTFSIHLPAAHQGDDSDAR